MLDDDRYFNGLLVRPRPELRLTFETNKVRSLIKLTLDDNPGDVRQSKLLSECDARATMTARRAPAQFSSACSRLRGKDPIY